MSADGVSGGVSGSGGSGRVARGGGFDVLGRRRVLPRHSFAKSRVVTGLTSACSETGRKDGGRDRNASNTRLAHTSTNINSISANSNNTGDDCSDSSKKGPRGLAGDGGGSDGEGDEIDRFIAKHKVVIRKQPQAPSFTTAQPLSPSTPSTPSSSSTVTPTFAAPSLPALRFDPRHSALVCASLVSLSLRLCSQLTNPSLSLLLTSTPHLKHIDISGTALIAHARVRTRV